MRAQRNITKHNESNACVHCNLRHHANVMRRNVSNARVHRNLRHHRRDHLMGVYDVTIWDLRPVLWEPVDPKFVVPPRTEHL